MKERGEILRISLTFVRRISRVLLIILARVSMTLELVHISRKLEAASYDEGNYFTSHFRISPRGLIHIHARMSTSSPKCATPVAVTVSLRFKYGLLILSLTLSLVPLSSLILSLNEDKYYLQYGIYGLHDFEIV